jgi:hypothetical protein
MSSISHIMSADDFDDMGVDVSTSIASLMKMGVVVASGKKP